MKFCPRYKTAVFNPFGCCVGMKLHATKQCLEFWNMMYVYFNLKATVFIYYPVQFSLHFNKDRRIIRPCRCIRTGVYPDYIIASIKEIPREVV
jgi:hypothetical protein